MKLAVSGKGGVGKSTLAAALALLLTKSGRRVLAIDADPDANLARALGIPEDKQAKIVPISEQVALIEERTGAKVKEYGQVFKLNPEVADIADNYAALHNGVALLVLGAVREGGGGCACPENVLIRALVSDLVLYKDEALVMDMEAGVEHLGRATSRGVDTTVVVVEPGQSSIDCARRILRLADEIGLRDLQFVANKVSSAEDLQFIKEALGCDDLLGVIPFSQEIRSGDRHGQSVLDNLGPELVSVFEDILVRLGEERL